MSPIVNPKPRFHGIRIVSPFDQIRHRDDDGHEYWSARELMPHYGYSTWQKFQVPIKKAMVTAEGTNMDLASHFAQSVNPVESGTGGNRTQADYLLTRRAACLVAMNADEKKPEIQAAQRYFLEKTVQAESVLNRIPSEMAAMVPMTYSEALRAYAREVDAREAAEAYVKELESKAESYDEFMDTDGTYSVGAVAKICGLTQNGLHERNAATSHTLRWLR